MESDKMAPVMAQVNRSDSFQEVPLYANTDYYDDEDYDDDKYEQWMMEDHPLRSYPTECCPGWSRVWNGRVFRLVCVVVVAVYVKAFLPVNEDAVDRLTYQQSDYCSIPRHYPLRHLIYLPQRDPQRRPTTSIGPMAL